MPKKRKKRSKSGKGSRFEREVARDLSLWWTAGKRDDIFWRTAGSGGRSTRRKKFGKTTYGQSGDLKADDPIGAPLLDLVAIELKRGYQKESIADLLDKTDSMAQQSLEEWIQQAKESCDNAGSFAWLVIQRRNQRCAVVFLPDRLATALRGQGVPLHAERPWFWFAVTIREKVPIDRKRFRLVKRIERIAAMRLEDFLRIVTPQDVRDLIEKV